MTLPARRTRAASRERSFGLSRPPSIVRSPSTRISTPAVWARPESLSTKARRAHTRSIPTRHPGHTVPRERRAMNTTQNIQRIIAAGLLAASAGLALSSCAGQRHITEPDSELTTDAQIAEQRAEYRDLAERRSEESRDRDLHEPASTSISPSAATVSADQWPATPTMTRPSAASASADRRRATTPIWLSGDSVCPAIERARRIGPSASSRSLVWSHEPATPTTTHCAGRATTTRPSRRGGSRRQARTARRRATDAAASGAPARTGGATTRHGTATAGTATATRPPATTKRMPRGRPAPPSSWSSGCSAASTCSTRSAG